MTPAHPVPSGFRVCALAAACYCLDQVVVLSPMSMDAPGGVWGLARGPVVLLACLAAVAAEALWRARPWAYRASVALALASGAMLVLGPGAVRAPTPVSSIVCAAVIVPVLAYIRGRSRRPWPAAAVPHPIPHSPAAMSPPRRAPRAPDSFYLGGTVAACFALLMAFAVVALNDGSLDQAGVRGARFGAALLATLAAVAAEALLRVRPWAYRACVVLAVVYAVVLVSTTVAWGGVTGLAAGAVLLLLSGMVVFPLLEYVRDGARRCWPPAAVPRPAPPPPWP